MFHILLFHWVHSMMLEYFCYIQKWQGIAKAHEIRWELLWSPKHNQKQKWKSTRQEQWKKNMFFHLWRTFRFFRNAHQTEFSWDGKSTTKHSQQKPIGQMRNLNSSYILKFMITSIDKCCDWHQPMTSQSTSQSSFHASFKKPIPKASILPTVKTSQLACKETTQPARP